MRSCYDPSPPRPFHSRAFVPYVIGMQQPDPADADQRTLAERAVELLLGRRRDVRDPKGFHRITLIIFNLRGVKESVRLLVPVFVTFLLTHVVLIGYGTLSHLHHVPEVAAGLSQRYHAELRTLGVGGMLLIFLRAYSLGGSSYT